MAKDKEKEIALQLYIYSNFSQKEIAEKLNVSEKTISAWAIAGNWEQLKLAHETSNTETIADLRTLLSALASQNKEKIKDKTFTKNDADMLLEVARTIDTLEGAIPLRVYVQVSEEFMKFIAQKNAKIKQELAVLQTEFLLSKS